MKASREKEKEISWLSKREKKCVLGVISLILILGSVNVKVAEGRVHSELGQIEYPAINCRKHSASLKDFGGVGDGKTSNTKNELEWPHLAVLPSYGRGRDAPGGRFSSLIFGTNLTDVVITGQNGTIDGQGSYWWDKFHKNQLTLTRPYMIEIMYSDQIQISDLTLVNSPTWFVHPIYSSNIIVKGLTILAPVDSPNTDGINPGNKHYEMLLSFVFSTDSCTNTRIEDCYIVSGDDCISAKSGWDEYGIKFGRPTQHLVIRRVTCISPDSAMVALGSEMSGGIEDVRVEDLTAINTESAVRIKTAVGRGGFVKNIFVRGLNLNTMKYVFWMTGSYGQHPDSHYDPKALPTITGINFKDVVAKNVTYSAKLEGISNDPFTGICISNVTIEVSALKKKKLQWNCTDVAGVTNNVTPPPCALLPQKDKTDCAFPNDKLPIEAVQFKTCSL
ncbi:polygalacturonase protein [Vigna angularis]|uniref:Polygalacturonase protein n=1 Tax=Phaseolus angularis TaxID=3914 RepID=A0A8T0JV08_PHAAN|nr:polygalacturonase protein [Vigna angularis]